MVQEKTSEPFWTALGAEGLRILQGAIPVHGDVDDHELPKELFPVSPGAQVQALGELVDVGPT